MSFLVSFEHLFHVKIPRQVKKIKYFQFRWSQEEVCKKVYKACGNKLSNSVTGGKGRHYAPKSYK